MSYEKSEVTEQIIGAAMDVHRELGPGLLESIYEDCLVVEFERRGLCFERQVMLKVMYKGKEIPHLLRLDLVVEREVIVEIKSVERLHPIHQSQLLTYLKISGLPVGLLLNFNEMTMKEGIRRVAHWRENKN